METDYCDFIGVSCHSLMVILECHIYASVLCALIKEDKAKIKSCFVLYTPYYPQSSH